MGRVKQHFMEEIEANYEYNCLNNPRFNLDPEPEPSIKEEFKTTIGNIERYLLCCCDLVEELKNSDYNILDKIDSADEMRSCLSILRPMVNHLEPMVNHLESLLKESWEEPAEEPDDEEPKEHPDQEHADAYSADQI